VYVVFGLHILHWKRTGRSLAPLELNEVMYTLELGIITAGFLFMCFLALGTLVFGRFFCSWACHIMVLQDLCSWLLGKLGLRHKPIRSRLLLLVPPLTAFYMFIWPQVVRAWQSRALPTFHWASDAEGWASLVTSNFWRNLPSAPIIALTFLTCGFVIVYLLGTRTFCNYVCPYGAIFALADRFSPLRIRVNDSCRQCGTCTQACTSGIRVHEEVKQHGLVVNPACLKDLDCVGSCPQHALRVAVARPALFKSWRTGRFGTLPYDFSFGEELVLAVVFLFGLLTFRGLYSRIPFLLALALAAVLAYLTVVALRLWSGRQKRTRGVAIAYTAFMIAAVAFVGHCAFVRYHEWLGLGETRQIQHTDDAQAATALAPVAYAHLQTADRWGLISNPNVERCILALSARSLQLTDAVRYAERLLQRYPDDCGVRLQLAQCLLRGARPADAEPHLRKIVAQAGGSSADAKQILLETRQALASVLLSRGDFAGAATELRAVVALEPKSPDAQAQLGGVLAEIGQFDDAIASLRSATQLDPTLAGAHYNLGAILGRLGRYAEAVPAYEQALRYAPNDGDLLNNLGFALLRTGQIDRAEESLQRALAVNPQHAGAHFNLGQLYAARDDAQRAQAHLQAAARLDPRYAVPQDTGTSESTNKPVRQ
jgi:tetratricopeptide (TPR) repeat protein